MDIYNILMIFLYGNSGIAFIIQSKKSLTIKGKQNVKRKYKLVTNDHYNNRISKLEQFGVSSQMITYDQRNGIDINPN